MNRRIVRDNCQVCAVRERDGKAGRTFGAGAVLNMLQWKRRGEARFTLEGEGAEIWVCEETAVHEATAP